MCEGVYPMLYLPPQDPPQRASRTAPTAYTATTLQLRRATSLRAGDNSTDAPTPLNPPGDPLSTAKYLEQKTRRFFSSLCTRALSRFLGLARD